MEKPVVASALLVSAPPGIIYEGVSSQEPDLPWTHVLRSSLENHRELQFHEDGPQISTHIIKTYAGMGSS